MIQGGDNLAKNKLLTIFLLAFFCLYANLIFLQKAKATTVAPTTQWVKTTQTAPASAEYYNGIALDSANSLYATGYITGTDEFDFGGGVKVTGANAGWNPLLVKHSSSGAVQWAKTAVVAPGEAYFSNIAIDTNNNIYAAGTIYGNGEFDFGDGVKVTGSDNVSNPILIKYNASGVPQWAKSTTAGTEFSSFFSVTCDSLGNVYTSGYINKNVEFNFGSGVTATGAYANSWNAVLVKYNSTGTPQWATTPQTAPNYSRFFDLATDVNNNIYTVGNIAGNQEFNFGSGVTITGGYVNDWNGILVKYNSSGTPQWAKTAEIAPNNTDFYSVTLDQAGNIYITGEIDQNFTYDFGNGVTVASGINVGWNPLIIKYSSSGVAQWAKSLSTGAAHSNFFYSAAVDDSGNSYVAGYTSGSGLVDLGNSVTLTGSDGDYNAFIIKYSTSGVPQWAKTTEAGSNESWFYDLAFDSVGNLYAGGGIGVNKTVDFGSGITTTGGAGAGSSTIVAVKYAWPSGGGSNNLTLENLPGEDRPINLNDNQTINGSNYIFKIKPQSNMAIAKVEFYLNGVLVKTATKPDQNGIYSYNWPTMPGKYELKAIIYDTGGLSLTLVRQMMVLGAFAELPQTGADLRY